MVSGLANKLIQQVDGQELKEGEIFHEGTKEAPLPAGLDNAGKQRVPLYDTRTGEERKINFFNVDAALKKTHQDIAYPEWIGRPLFSRTPTVDRVLGTHKCWMVPGQEWSAAFGARGFQACDAAHLQSAATIISHLKSKHKSEYAQLEAERLAKERDEDRAESKRHNDAMLAALSGNRTPTTPLDIITNPDVAPAVATAIVASPTPSEKASCSKCGREFVKETRGKAAAAVRMHERTCTG